jgi:hypothetical protein
LRAGRSPRKSTGGFRFSVLKGTLMTFSDLKGTLKTFSVLKGTFMT